MGGGASLLDEPLEGVPAGGLLPLASPHHPVRLVRLSFLSWSRLRLALLLGPPVIADDHSSFPLPLLLLLSERMGRGSLRFDGRASVPGPPTSEADAPQLGPTRSPHRVW